MHQASGRRPTWAETNLDHLAFNFHSTRAFIGKDVKTMAVVKANAYGHGAVECAKRLEKEGADWFAVAIPEEASELRNGGIRCPILCLGGFYFGQENEIIDREIRPVIFRLDLARSLNETAKRLKTVVPIHIKVDTGMGRVGVRWDTIREFGTSLREFEYLSVEGMMTHFAAADDLGENEFTRSQMTRFNEAVSVFRDLGLDPAILHLANSPGAVAHPDSRASMARLGGILYGLGGDVLPRGIETPQLKPVLSLHSQISLLKRVPAGESIGYGRTFVTERDSLIATIPIGYADGLDRRLSNIGRAIVKGEYVPFAGRISMDWATLDVTDIPGVRTEDPVLLIGESNGKSIRSEDIAGLLGTISYEVTCSIGERVSKVFR